MGVNSFWAEWYADPRLGFRGSECITGDCRVENAASVRYMFWYPDTNDFQQNSVVLSLGESAHVGEIELSLSSAGVLTATNEGRPCGAMIKVMAV